MMGFQQQIGPMPIPAVAHILSRYTRPQLEGFISVAIDLLDVVDGDPDAEVEDRAGETVPVIDDPEVPPEEDEGDPDLEETDCEDSFVLSGQALGSAHGAGCSVSDPGGAAQGEDDEEDDPSGQIDEDGINTSQDLVRFQQGSSGPGCMISDAAEDGGDTELNGDEGDYTGGVPYWEQ